MMMAELNIRNMKPRDWPQVLRIYLQGIATGQATFETTAPEWAEWDVGHLETCRMVAEKGGTLAGWVALSPVSKRMAYAGVAELSIYVAQKIRGQGVGKALMERVVPASEEQGIWTLYASIFPENLGSTALLTRSGFRRVGIRERIAKQNGVWRDTLILERRSSVVN
jgi:L-amino acid N-acyltransferase YncA